ncbi:MAG: aldolase/citrate lyase family protein [Halohasta sp.]
MRVENGLRAALEADETVFGAACATFSPTVIETLGAVGLDFVWLDFEHGGPSPYDSTVFEELTRAAETGGIELLVRIPKPEPPLVRKVLDAGVRSILIPRIETADQLRPAVAAAHFAYDGGVGDRGVGVGRTSEWAGYVDSHVGGEDDQVLVGTMIENTRAVDNIEEICSVPQLGFAFIGPADLSMSMSDGEPLDDHPDRLQAAIDRTREACLDAGLPVGRIHNDPADARQAVDDGVQMVRLGGDTGAIREVLDDRLSAVDL